ncbi:MAG: branched-chain amino acid ABC transporter permease, partial [Flavobacteriaceae bacterium]|nr:branched-chain amino acid ABC transporter permease [Flavobacteriaceae bacterium]
MAQTIFRRWGREFAIAGAIVLYLLPLLGMDIRTYLTLTIAGLAMGMMLFLVASGLSLIFGLMDVINFAHGVCFAYGAYVAFSVFKYLNSWVETDSLFQNFSIFFIAIIAAIIVVGILGIIIERVLIRRVYGSHLFQILITFGGMVVLTEFIRIIWGPNDEVMPQPITFSGNWNIFDIIILKYPIFSIVLGLAVYGIIQLVLKRTKVGKIVRAGVEDPEMVQA